MCAHSTRSSIRLLVIALCACAHYQCANGIFDFPKLHHDFSANSRNYLNSISEGDWQKFTELGCESVDKQKSLEENILNSQITVQNGSISHAQLLDALPNAEAKKDSEIALKILKSSLYIYNTECAQNDISGEDCANYLMEKPLPEGTQLQKDCASLLQSRRDGHNPFSRLLPRYYNDGFHEMFSDEKRAAPQLISNKVCAAVQPLTVLGDDTNMLDENGRSLSLVQWTQFIEHDLSKPVVTSMSNGSPIECCNENNFKLQPRYNHPACAPLLQTDANNKYGRESCLNYVRSALAVGPVCAFGAAEQLNQATGYLDLSQLYGFTDRAERAMRTFKDGKIRSTHAPKLHRELLPMAKDESSTFCALKFSANNSLCFRAGDSRVNSNPYAIVLYTIFMRNHNQIAHKLKLKYPDWRDFRLYHVAKSINIGIYRRIVFNEWLPAVLGATITDQMNREPLDTDNKQTDTFQISNEFGVAAIRFYFSMMPDVLYNFAAIESETEDHVGRPTTEAALLNNNILPDPNIFVLKDQLFKPNLTYTSMKLNSILESVLHQRAMRMDTSYADSLTLSDLRKTRPTHADILAFDIQRGRDHGLQGYVKYLEVCNDIKIDEWKDLEPYINKQTLTKLQSVYNNWGEIDLIVGGIAELPVNGSTVGPTFSCILAEQFSKIRQWQHALITTVGESPEMKLYQSVTAADLLCANSDLKSVPTNIFQLDSHKNPLLLCAERWEALRL